MANYSWLLVVVVLLVVVLAIMAWRSKNLRHALRESFFYKKQCRLSEFNLPAARINRGATTGNNPGIERSRARVGLYLCCRHNDVAPGDCQTKLEEKSLLFFVGTAGHCSSRLRVGISVVSGTALVDLAVEESIDSSMNLTNSCSSRCSCWA